MTDGEEKKIEAAKSVNTDQPPQDLPTENNEKLKSIEAKDSMEEMEVIEKPPKDFVYKEGGWGWVVVIATSYCFGILVGMMNNYALIYNKFEIVYNGTENHIFYAGKFSLIKHFFFRRTIS